MPAMSQLAPKARLAVEADPTILEGRFRALLGPEQWQHLPQAVKLRFSKRLSPGESTVYVGRITDTTFSTAGWVLAQALRLIGGPLPYRRDVGVASAVTVTEDLAGGGQNWTRLYANRQGFPQVIHSAKRFTGHSGLEEYVGSGIAMALRLSVDDGALVFHSAGYSLRIGRLRLKIPAFLCPGTVEVTHRDLGGGQFRFSLRLTHAWLGQLVFQSGIFQDERK